MSVDYYPCDRCNNVYCDCGYYVNCDEDGGGCGRSWCSDKCAELDGYKECSCKLGKDIDNQGYLDDECEYADGLACHMCENFIKASCSHCRGEIISDDKILDYALKLLNKTKEEIILEIKGK